MSGKHNRAYGSWPSEITATFIASSGVRIGNLALGSSKEGGDVALHWLEGRPQEQGRNALVKFVGKGTAGASERGAVDVTPADVNVRSRVHEYGGGAFLIAPQGGVIYSEYTSQRLYWSGRAGDSEPMCLTPESTWKAGRYRFADGQVTPSGEHLVIVREDHGEDGDAPPAAVVNEVVKLALDGSGDMQVLATGADFYAAPRVSPDGSHVAYVCWDHPSMPWDATQLRVASIKSGIAETASHALVDGADGDTSVLQPDWHPRTGALYYISDGSGFYTIRRLPPLPTGADALSSLEPADAIAPRNVDLGGSSPGWSLGQQGYAFLSDGRVAAHAPDRDTGRTALLVFDEADGTAGSSEAADRVSTFTADDGLPHMFGGLTPAEDGTLYMIGGGPDVPSGVYAWRGLISESAGEIRAAELIASSSNASIEDGYCSVPQPIDFESTLGTAYGYYYPPTNPKYYSTEEAPPLLVKAHGGPTAATSAAYNPTIQFWTSRGFAVLDVDYGGSTGYGREYRRRLRGNWGVVDVDDVCAGAQALVARGLADAKRLAIDGGSAGGYTTLGALAFRDVFTASCSLYGVADLSTLARDTHKFESRYLDGLVGKLPEDQALYDERAPIKKVEQLSCPILLLQGDEDKIVPPNQATLMHEALLRKGLPCALKLYKGEQHGFRKAENIVDALNSELYFYSKVFGFECAGDDIVPFEIDNLS